LNFFSSSSSFICEYSCNISRLRTKPKKQNKNTHPPPSPPPLVCALAGYVRRREKE
jgi:hypothetical protein